MAKYYDIIGFVITEETSPGVFTETVCERAYSGDILKNTRMLQTIDQVNDNVNVSNEISIVADAYAIDNFYAIRYARFMREFWKVSNISVDPDNPHRLRLSLGGVYNGK